jgi:hypothetical protein
MSQAKVSVFDRQELLGAMVPCIQVKNCSHNSSCEPRFDRTVEMTRGEFKLRHRSRLNPDMRKNPSFFPFLLRRGRRLGASVRNLATHPPTLTFSSELPSSPRTLALFLLAAPSIQLPRPPGRVLGWSSFASAPCASTRSVV